jgi:hypothetical protein
MLLLGCLEAKADRLLDCMHADDAFDHVGVYKCMCACVLTAVEAPANPMLLNMQMKPMM